ncbi:MAG: tyrosine-type recombinase/integrase [Candidatus Micrarchaeota archaeon]|nr:tyrosine-type recombinase/integrase [Candidatus Micrarchaeota archaeon]MDE1834610.1 tyrosine-type recombinase/integrase [Candidatus Micrarchaeota archaeon]MDE1859322.1 tyrosine-type recombinase/integrase [Candidatus Micrarchaeota archaeon]
MSGTVPLEQALKMINDTTTCEANKKLILDFIPYLKSGAANGKKPAKDNTIVRHLYCYKKILEYWPPEKELIKADRDQIIRLMNAIDSATPITLNGEGRNKVLSEGTKAKVRLIIKMLFKHYVGEDEVYPRQVSWIKTTDRSEMSITSNDLISKNELNQMISCTLNLRDSAIIALLSEGLRPHELLALKRKNLDLDSEPPHIFIPPGTKHGRRTEPILFSVPFLARYLDTIKGLEGEDPLFLHNLTDGQKRPMTYDALRMMVQKCAKRAGVSQKRRVWLYLFRHTAITRDAEKYSSHITAKRHGTSPRMLEKHYVHLISSDVDNAFMRENNLKKKEEDEQPTVRPCLRCNYVNSLNTKYCGRCGSALDKDTARQQLTNKEDLRKLAFAYIKNEDDVKKQFEMLRLLDQKDKKKE